MMPVSIQPQSPQVPGSSGRNAPRLRGTAVGLRSLLGLTCSIALLAGCASTAGKPGDSRSDGKRQVSAGPPPMMQQIVPGPVTVKEGYLAKREAESRLIGLAFVQNPFGAPWVYAADANTDDLAIFDAPTGRFVKRFGKHGTVAGEFNGITGLDAVENTLFVAESGSHRVQMFYLPDINPLASFGEAELKSPEGVFVRSLGAGRFHAYVIDNEGGQLVIKIFEVSPVTKETTTEGKYGYETAPTQLNQKQIGSVALGIPAGTAVSIKSDPANSRVLIAYGKTLKPIGFAGEPLGSDLPLSDLQGVASGIGLFACPNDADKGYWIVSDRGPEEQLFRVYDRKTLQPLTSFRGEKVRNSSAMVFTMESMAFFNFGATFAIHDNTAVGSMSWETLAQQTGLRRICL